SFNVSSTSQVLAGRLFRLSTLVGGGPGRREVSRRNVRGRNGQERETGRPGRQGGQLWFQIVIQSDGQRRRIDPGIRARPVPGTDRSADLSLERGGPRQQPGRKRQPQ